MIGRVRYLGCSVLEHLTPTPRPEGKGHVELCVCQ